MGGVQSSFYFHYHQRLDLSVIRVYLWAKVSGPCCAHHRGELRAKSLVMLSTPSGARDRTRVLIRFLFPPFSLRILPHINFFLSTSSFFSFSVCLLFASFTSKSVKQVLGLITQNTVHAKHNLLNNFYFISIQYNKHVSVTILYFTCTRSPLKCNLDTSRCMQVAQ